uniref:Uncharacterized protein n=1 Tax=Timspurckia oligopyrenoides TaxID=708627 RepID=A0A7S0ZEG5_9RHOD
MGDTDCVSYDRKKRRIDGIVLMENSGREYSNSSSSESGSVDERLIGLENGEVNGFEEILYEGEDDEDDEYDPEYVVTENEDEDDEFEVVDLSDEEDELVQSDGEESDSDEEEEEDEESENEDEMEFDEMSLDESEDEFDRFLDKDSDEYRKFLANLVAEKPNTSMNAMARLEATENGVDNSVVNTNNNEQRQWKEAGFDEDDDESDTDFDYIAELSRISEVREEFRNDYSVRVSIRELKSLAKASQHLEFESQYQYPLRMYPQIRSKYTPIQPKYNETDQNACELILGYQLEMKRVSQYEQTQKLLQSHIQLMIQSILLTIQQCGYGSMESVEEYRKILRELEVKRDCFVEFQKHFGMHWNLESTFQSIYEHSMLNVLPNLDQLIEKAKIEPVSGKECSEMLLLTECLCELLPKFDSHENSIDLSVHGLKNASDFVRLQKLVNASSSRWMSAEDEILKTFLIRDHQSPFDYEFWKLHLVGKSKDDIVQRWRELSLRNHGITAWNSEVRGCEKSGRILIDKCSQLSKFEWKLVDRGLELFGNDYCKIQSVYLPNRDPVLLEKLNQRRQRKRELKRKERLRKRSA